MAEIYDHNGEVMVRMDLVESVFRKSKIQVSGPNYAQLSSSDPSLSRVQTGFGLTLHLREEEPTRRSTANRVHLNVLDQAAEDALYTAFLAAWEGAVTDNVDEV